MIIRIGKTLRVTIFYWKHHGLRYDKKHLTVNLAYKYHQKLFTIK